MGLGIWAAAGSQGLWRGTPGGIWRQYEAPPQPMRLAQGGGRVVAACAGGEVFEVSSRLLLGQCPGVEAMALSSDGRYVYLLSGETDSLMCCISIGQAAIRGMCGWTAEECHWRWLQGRRGRLWCFQRPNCGC